MRKYISSQAEIWEDQCSVMYAGARARVKFDQLEAGLDKKLKNQAELARAQTEYRNIAYGNARYLEPV